METIELRCQHIPSAGRQIQALLPKGFKLENSENGIIEEEFWTCVWSERWVQFPTEDWEALQDRIMRAIQKVLDDSEGLLDKPVAT